MGPYPESQSQMLPPWLGIASGIIVFLGPGIVLITLLIGVAVSGCCRKKEPVASKKVNQNVSNTPSGDDPPSKKCNTKGGLLADDPDLKSMQLRQLQEKQAMSRQATAPKESNGNNDDTVLKSFDEGGNKKKAKNDPDQTKEAPTQVTAAGDVVAVGQSAYCNKPATNAINPTSMLAMNKVDKDKIPPKLKPKESEVIAQDSTQSESKEEKKEKDKKTPSKNTPSKNADSLKKQKESNRSQRKDKKDKKEPEKEKATPPIKESEKDVKHKDKDKEKDKDGKKSTEKKSAEGNVEKTQNSEVEKEAQTQIPQTLAIAPENSPAEPAPAEGGEKKSNREKAGSRKSKENHKKTATKTNEGKKPGRKTTTK